MVKLDAMFFPRNCLIARLHQAAKSVATYLVEGAAALGSERHQACGPLG